MLTGYARCSTAAQDRTAQRDALTALGVQPDRIYVDHGLTGTSRARPGLREALAAPRRAVARWPAHQRRAIFRRPLNRLPGRQPRWRTSTSTGPPMSS
jgi:hypothetical protein